MMSNITNTNTSDTKSHDAEPVVLSESKFRFCSIVRDFALTTSIHGLPSVARSRNKLNCTFWIVSFLFYSVILVYCVTRSLEHFFAYPTQISISIDIERSQIFPAVTICNYSPIRYDTFISTFLNYTNSINITDAKDTKIFSSTQASMIYDILRIKLNANESIDDYCFSLDLMLIECLYNDRLCSASDFTNFKSSKYGCCYTFNAKTKTNNESTIRRTNDNGGTGQLILRLYAHSDLYVPYVSRDVSAGMVAMVHANTQLPLIDVAGIELQPGRKHKLGYKKKTTHFLSSPYTKCARNVPLVMQAMFDRYDGADYTYSQRVCYLLCVQAYIYKQCKCVNPEQWTARSVVVPNSSRILEAALCDYGDPCYWNAISLIFSTASIWNEYCSQCTQECCAVEFLLTISSVSAPSHWYANITKDFVESRRNETPNSWSTNWLSEIQKNYVGLEVICQSIEVENYTQQPSIHPVDLVSDVGGHAGLWLGISFLSIMELVEMLYRVFRHRFHIIRKQIQRRMEKVVK